MKKTLILLIFIIPLCVFAQDKALKKADDNFNKFYFDKALSQYIKLEDKGISKYYVTRRIADCYRLLNMPVLATEWYEKAVQYPDVEAETYYLLGLSLRILKRYEESERFMSRYYSITKTQSVQNGLSLENYLTFIRSDSLRAEITNLGINTNYSEFGPVVWQEELIFTSNRPKDERVRLKDSRNNLPFSSLFSAPISHLQNNRKTVRFQPQLDTKYNDGPICFTYDNTMAYITHNTAPDQTGKSDLDIKAIRILNGKFDKAYASLPLKLKGYSIMHPTVSPNGDRLYFVSNMPGGYGGMDIYYSEIRGGFLSQPINLGPTINTPGNEVFPHISTDGKLYFASNGHPGLGGLDIFVALPIGNSFSSPFNLGPGINSSHDDFSIFVEEDGQSGYFASNRPGGKGDDDIYSFRMIRPLKFTMINATIINKTTSLPEQNVLVTVTKRDGTLVASLECDTEGNFNIQLVRDETYKISFRKRLMTTVEKDFTPNQMRDFNQIDVSIEMESL